MGTIKARSLVVALMVTIGTLALSSTCFAAGIAGSTFEGKANNLQSEVQNRQGAGVQDARGGSGSSASKSSASGLPFSALDVTVLLGGGLLLIASGVTLSGVVLRRVRV
jgi:hypothetical protein